MFVKIKGVATEVKGGGNSNKFDGECGHCGKYGHRVRECWVRDKEMEAIRNGKGGGDGKGFGKGNGKGYGWNDYQSKGNGKGYGGNNGYKGGGYKGGNGFKGGGKGKGMYWLDTPPEQQSSEHGTGWGQAFNLEKEENGWTKTPEK